jgi:hypothetical protein
MWRKRRISRRGSANTTREMDLKLPMKRKNGLVGWEARPFSDYIVFIRINISEIHDRSVRLRDRPRSPASYKSCS